MIPRWVVWPLAGAFIPVLLAFAPSHTAQPISPAHDSAHAQVLALRETQDAQLAKIDAMIATRQALIDDLASIADLVPPQYRLLVLGVARQEGLAPRLIAAQGWVESRWQADAVGTSGERGVMQIMPSTAEWIAEQMGLDTYDLNDPATNVAMGARYLRLLIDEHGSVDNALAAYNAGPAYATRAPAAARSYVDRVRMAAER